MSNPPASDAPARAGGAPAAVLPASRAVPVPSRPRRTPSAGQIARRQRFVWLVKLVLPALIMALLGLLFLWPEFEGREGRLSFRRGPSMTPEALQVVAPRYQGIDEINRPYTVTAQTARQPGQDQILLLDSPQADILLNDGAWVYLESREGRYDRPRQALDLWGDVRLFHDGGTMFRTEAAVLQVDTGHASGNRPTQAQGPFGTIESEGFEMRDRGAVMIFTGRAHAVLEGRQQ
ncbi:LPS export ABC transporter periplasmic protein LptC [Sabulicella glaciei]|uniref:LPS export ABC transporter periplasmic protein LptC n=1 Tax=Sabulicella glaciei TaxID=2984948 RepID=A0ABT3NQP6_9PROT|nr:LPS export ABC transporter periplasmic protein LptC [Roseococcus sp. MDT2-1-1]